MNRLRFGTFLAPNIMPVYQAVTEEVGRRLGLETELVVETELRGLRGRPERGLLRLQPPLRGVRASRRRHRPSPSPRRCSRASATAAGPSTSPTSSSTATARSRSFLDLRGRSWAYNEPLSHSGYGITRYHLVELGETHGFFSEVVEAGFHEESMRMVACARGRRLGHRLPGAGGAAARRSLAGSLAAHHRRPRPLDHPAGRRVEAGPARAPRARSGEVLTTMHEDPRSARTPGRRHGRSLRAGRRFVLRRHPQDARGL